MEKIGEDQSNRGYGEKKRRKILKGVYTVYNQNIGIDHIWNIYCILYIRI